MAAAGGGSPRTPSSGMYYSRKKKSSEPNSSAFTPGLVPYPSSLALPDANKIRNWGYSSASKDWENIPRHIVLDSDDEDGNIAVCKETEHEENKTLTASQWTGNFTNWMESKGWDQANETMQAEGQIIPYGLSTALVGQVPLQTSWQPSIQFEKVVLQKRPEEERMQDLVAASIAEKRAETQVFLSLPSPSERKRRRSDPTLHVNEDGATARRQIKRKGEPDSAAVGFPSNLKQTDISSETDMPMVEEEKPKNESDGLEDYWKDFALAVESTKLDASDEAANEKEDIEKEVDNDCIHDIRIHEDLGHVCRICVASRRRTNTYEGQHSKDADEIDYGPVKLSEDFIVAHIAIHPRHAKQMRPHQLEGFNFLVKNLVADKPGGCILAHAPGSGKTFMLISFIQSFLARYPSARPLVVLPKGILGTWKREIQRWQVQDIPVYDFYSVKADKRTEQLEILKSWEDKMSILFLGYNQFSRIVSGDGGGNVAAACRDRLLKVPNLLILDEGHTPRTQETDVLETLKRVETPRKVVLSAI
ncbi:hypothetical protein ACP70R_046005 [Stipagrostis hirtigluma subsp. patula]